MEKYNNPQAPVGSIISGEFLKEMVAAGWIAIETAIIDGKEYSSNEALDDLDSDDQLAVLVNQNSGQVQFVPLFTGIRAAYITNNRN